MRTIQLKSSDDNIFDVKESIAKQSNLIREVLERKESKESDEIMVPVANVSGRTLGMVIEWMVMHSDEVLEKKHLEEWETEFVDLDDMDLMYDLTMAACDMDVTELFHRVCQKVADLIAGNQPEEVRRIFKIENDFTPEEEAELRRQNGWVFPSDTTTTTTTTNQ